MLAMLKRDNGWWKLLLLRYEVRSGDGRGNNLSGFDPYIDNEVAKATKKGGTT